MTFNASLLSAPAHPFQIRYIDRPRQTSSVRRHRVAVAARRVSVATVTAAAVLVGAIGAANAATVNSDGVIRTDPVRGEYRLAPGNQQPPGYVIPLGKASRLSGPMPGEFRLGPGNQVPPGVLVTLA